MPKTLALIHTSFVFVKVETIILDLLSEILPDVRLINIVDDSLLSDVMAAGKIIPSVTKRMCAYVVAAEATGADAVLSLCSSVGPTIDIARKLVNIPVVKIDEAMAEKAVREASRIGVLATVPTTLSPTVDLIQQKAITLGKQVEIFPGLADGAFQMLMSGHRDEHDAIVAETACKLVDRVDLLVLAQASMTRLAPRLQTESGLPVLTSPRLGIELTKCILNQIDA